MRLKLVVSLGLILAAGGAQAALQARDLDGNLANIEAYYDTVLDITWLQDSTYAKTSGHDEDGYMTWEDANDWASNLRFYNPLSDEIYSYWRLPGVKPVNGVAFSYFIVADGSTDRGYNISEQGTLFAGSTASEMAHLFYNTLDNKGLCDPALSTPTLCAPQAFVLEAILLNGPFNLDASRPAYWSGTPYEFGNRAWKFDFGGRQEEETTEVPYNAWAVHDGDVGVAVVPEADTYALLLAGLAAMTGWLRLSRSRLG